MRLALALIGALLFALAKNANAELPRKYAKPETLPKWHLVEELSRRLIAEQPSERELAERELLALGVPAVHPLLIIGIRSEPQSAAVRRLWPRFGDAFITEAVETDVSEGSVAPCQVAAGLGQAVLPRLRRLAETEELRGQRFAFCVLREMKDEGVSTLIELASPSRPFGVREKAINELIASRDERGASLFLRGLSDSSADIRQLSATGVGRLKEGRAVPQLLTMVADETQSARYREVALYALGVMSFPSLREELARPAWRDKDSFVRKSAANALLQQRDRVAQRLGARYSPTRHSAMFPYYTWGPRVGAGSFFLCLATFVAARSRRAFGLVLAGLVGLYWGFVVKDVWFETEMWLLCVFVPVTIGSLLAFGCSREAVLIVLGWALVNALGTLATLLTPVLGLVALGLPTIGQYAFPSIALIGLYRHREIDPATLAKDRRATALVGGVFYFTYAVSFAALWGFLGL